MTSLDDVAQFSAGLRVSDVDAAETGRRMILVLGMHRSGTSAVAGALSAVGAWAGDDAELMPPDAHNQLGYFERFSTAATLDNLLLELGGTWSHPPLDNLRPRILERYRPALRGLLSEVVSRTPADLLPLVKDPRLCLFASELATLIDDSAVVVLSVRHPLEVAQSLLERDSIPIPVGLALWEAYNASACSGLAGRTVHVVGYDHLLEDGLVLERLISHTMRVDEALLGDGANVAAQRLVDAFRRQRVAADSEDWLIPPITRLWRTLNELAQTMQPMRLEEVALSQASRELLQLESDRHRFVPVADAASRSALPVDVLTRQLKRARAEARRLSAELAKGHDALEAAASQRDASERQRLELEEQVSQLAAERDRSLESTAALKSERDASEALRRQLDEQVSQLVEERDDLLESTAALKSERDASEALRRQLDDQVSQLVGERDRLLELTAALTGERDAAETLWRQLEEQLWQRIAERDLFAKEAATTRRRAVRLAMRARRVAQLRAETQAEYAAAVDVVTALQRQAEALAEDAAAFRDEIRRLEEELAGAAAQLDARVAELIVAHDRSEVATASLRDARRELADTRAALEAAEIRQEELRATIDRVVAERRRLSDRLLDVQERHAESQHRLLVERDRAYGFIESLRSVVGNFHPDVVLEWLDSAELINWAEATAKERERLAATHAVLLRELADVNRHREQLVHDVTEICESESFRLGWALTGPFRFARRRWAALAQTASIARILLEVKHD